MGSVVLLHTSTDWPLQEHIPSFHSLISGGESTPDGNDNMTKNQNFQFRLMDFHLWNLIVELNYTTAELQCTVVTFDPNISVVFTFLEISEAFFMQKHFMVPASQT